MTGGIPNPGFQRAALRLPLRPKHVRCSGARFSESSESVLLTSVEIIDILRWPVDADGHGLNRCDRDRPEDPTVRAVGPVVSHDPYVTRGHSDRETHRHRFGREIVRVGFGQLFTVHPHRAASDVDRLTRGRDHPFHERNRSSGRVSRHFSMIETSSAGRFGATSARRRRSPWATLSITSIGLGPVNGT